MSVCTVCETTQDPELPQEFCCHCGWPLARLQTEISSDPVILTGDEPERVTVTLANKGTGTLHCRIQAPDGLIMAAEQSLEYTIRDEPVTLHCQLDPAVLKTEGTASPLMLSITSSDKHPDVFRDRDTGAGTYRGSARHGQALERTTPLPISYAFLRLGPISVLNSALMFRDSHSTQSLVLHNGGETEVKLLLECTNGFTLKSTEDSPQAIALPIKLLPKTYRTLFVTAPDRPRPGFTGTVRVSSPGLIDVDGKPVQHFAVDLYWVPGVTIQTTRKRFVIGIDFGTAKTAVFYIDRLAYPSGTNVLDMKPICVPFYFDDKPHSTIPSEIMFPSTGGLPRIGYEAFSNLPGDLVIRSMKSILSSSTPRKHPFLDKSYEPLEIVTEFLQGLISQIRQSPAIPRDYPDDDPFDNAQVVMTLPLLDEDAQFDLQKELTLLAAHNAGLQDVEIICEKEPECAIVDILRRKQEYQLDIRKGEIGIIVDAGAGTLDISVLQVEIKDGQPTFSRLTQAGYPVGGDMVDELIYADYIRESRAQLGDKFVEPADRQSILLSLRDLKHALPLIATDNIPHIETHAVTSEIITEDGIKYTLSWAKINTLLRPLMDKILRGDPGLTAEEVTRVTGREFADPTVVYPSLTQKFWRSEPRIDPNRISWICLTGGTSVIPAIRTSLQQMFLRNPPIIPSIEAFEKLYKVTPNFFVLNVAQGAAIRPLFHFEGMWSMPFRIECLSRRHGQKVMPRVAARSRPLEQPGDQSALGTFEIERSDVLEVRVFGEWEDKELLLGRCFLDNSAGQNSRDATLSLLYTGEQCIQLKILSTLFADATAEPPQNRQVAASSRKFPVVR